MFNIVAIFGMWEGHHLIGLTLVYKSYPSLLL